MHILDHYLMVMEKANELKANGVEVKIEPIEPYETVSKWLMLPSEHWCTITFYAVTDEQVAQVFAARDYLWAHGTFFDYGSGLGCIEWSIDSSLHTQEYYDQKEQEYRNSLN